MFHTFFSCLAYAATVALHSKMSNVYDPEKIELSPAAQMQKTSLRTTQWSSLKNDLNKALDTWQELEKRAQTLSPEEEQLREIKNLISQVKLKLEQFSR